MITNSGLGDTGQIATSAGGSIGSALLTAGGIAAATPAGIPLMIAGGAILLATGLMHAFGVGVRNPYEDKDVITLNNMEQSLQANLSLWNQSSKTSEQQQQALAQADYILSQLPVLCSDPGLGENWASGCINDRKPGGKYDWTAMYRTPIASATPSDAGSLASMVGSGNVMYVAGGVALIGALLVSSD